MLRGRSFPPKDAPPVPPCCYMHHHGTPITNHPTGCGSVPVGTCVISMQSVVWRNGFWERDFPVFVDFLFVTKSRAGAGGRAAAAARGSRVGSPQSGQISGRFHRTLRGTPGWAGDPGGLELDGVNPSRTTNDFANCVTIAPGRGGRDGSDRAPSTR